MSEFQPIRVLLRRVARRLRVQRALEAVSAMLLLSGAWLLIAIFMFKIRHLTPDQLPLMLLVAAFFPVAALLAALLRPIRPMVAAQLIDRRLGLKDQFGSAQDFSSRGDVELSPYAAYELEKASGKAQSVNPREALPLRLPRTLGVFLLQLLAVVVLALVPAFPEPPPAQAAVPPPDVQGMAVEYDDLYGLNESLQEVHQEALDEEIDEVAEAAEEFNRLLQDLADQRLPYREALERIAALEQKLAREPWEPDPEAERFLEQVGRDLESSKIMEKTGEALREQKLREARDEVRQTAKQVERETPSKRELEQLKQALKRAVERQPPDREKQLEQLVQEERRLKQKRTANKQQEAAQKRRLKQNKRELDRLRRNLEKQQQKQRQLERLSRDMQQMAESLNLQGAEGLEQALQQMGEDINRMAREQTTEEQMQQLRQRLEELRRLLQQLQRGGKGFKVRLSQFNKGAQCGGKSGGSGKNGEGGGDGKTISLTPGGRDGKGLLPLKIPGGSSGGSKGQSPGQEQPGGGEGDGIGDSHDPNTQGKETKIKAQYTDIQVSPQQGEGPAKSEVIETAADQGFASPGYGEVHQTYERHAESLMEKQDIPPGYRRYIRQYFERIRPR